MHTRVKELARRLDDIASANNLSDNAFCVIYGTYPDGVANATSDIDLFIANEKYDQSLFQELREIVIGVHKKFNIPLDEEVSFENKLLVTFEEIEKASRLNGMDMRNGRFLVPYLMKTKSYLGSEQIKLRLLFNAFSVPHYVLWVNDYYWSIRSRVLENLFWLAIDLLHTDHCTLNEIENILFVGKDLRVGEEYLGYKPHPKVIQNIRKNILNEVIRLNDNGIIAYNHNTHNVQILDIGKLKSLKKEFVGSSKTFKVARPEDDNT